MRHIGAMDRRYLWIGGTSVAMAAVLGATAIAARSLYPADGPQTPAKPTISDPRGAIAQKIAADRRRPFTVRRVLPITGPIRYGEWHWDDAGVPDGPMVITVDLDARVISVFRDGYEIGAAAVMLGTDEHPTPLGTFPILSKERHNVSEKYGNAPMPWTLRLTHDGIAIHGGATVENGYASHGCVGVPDELAKRLFAVVSTGDKVVITRGKQLELGENATT